MRLAFSIVLVLTCLEAYKISAFLHAVPSSTSRIRTSVYTTTDETSAEALLLPDDDEDGESENDDNFSLSKWKKKRYMMMNDVDRRIQRGDIHAPKKAQDLVHRMTLLYEKSRHDEYKPTVQAYNLWINALAKSKQPNAGQQAEQVLKEMQQHQVQPNVISYTSVIDAYARSGKSKRGKNNNAAEQAERVLFELLERQLVDTTISISSVTCDAVLNAWAQQSSYEAAERAQAILERMEQLQNNDIQPTAHSYSTVINGWAKCSDGQAAERAEALLERMLKKPAQQTVKPDTVVFNGVIHAWATSGDARAGPKAVVLLNKMQDLSLEGYDTKPDVITFNSVISSWSHSGHVNAAQEAERVLKGMQKAANEKEEAPKPNTVSYNSVLHAWSKSSFPGAAHRAQSVLEYMMQASKNGGNKDIAPDVYSFTSVLNAWAKSKEADKAARARKGLDQLLDLFQNTNNKSLRPSVIPFNTVLNACAFSAMGTTPEQQREALQIAVSTFTLLRKTPRVGPDSLTYGNMIKCCANLMPMGDTRNSMATQLFQKCCEEGMVGDLVWNEMKRAVPNRVLDKIVQSQTSIRAPSGSLRVRDLPKEWWKRTIKRKRKPTRRKKTEEEAPKRSGPLRPTGKLRETSWESSQM